MKVNLHVVGDEDVKNAQVAADGLNAFVTGPDPLEELLNEFSGLDDLLEEEILEQERAREREIEEAMNAQIALERERANAFIPQESKLDRVLSRMRELEENLKYLSFLTHEIEHYGP